MVYTLWAVSMLIPALVATRGRSIDRRPVATRNGLIIGLSGAGGQLLLLKVLTMGPAYLIFPIVAVSPAITVVLALVLLRERLTRLALFGVVLTTVAVVLFSIGGGGSPQAHGPWLVLAMLISVAWGVQAYFMRKAASAGTNDATTFAWMTGCGLLLVPFAIWMAGGIAASAPWQAPVLAGATQLLNALAALSLLMALSRGKASLVTPTTNALAPVVTIALSLLLYRTLPSGYGGLGIVLALTGSTLMIYSDERRGEAPAGAAEQIEEPASRPP